MSPPIVLLAGVGVPMEDLLIQQARDIAQVTGASEEEIAKNAELQRRMFRLVKEEKLALPVGGGSCLCRVRTYKTKVLGMHATMTVADSEEFKWTNVSTTYKDIKGGLLYAVEVAECGSKK